MWPEGADGQLCLHPPFGHHSRDVPDGIALGPPVDLHVDIEGAGAGVVPAGQVIVEVDAVSVIFLQRGQQQVSFLPRCSPRAVHHHVGACRAKKEENKGWVCLDFWYKQLCLKSQQFPQNKTFL